MDANNRRLTRPGWLDPHLSAEGLPVQFARATEFFAALFPLEPPALPWAALEPAMPPQLDDPAGAGAGRPVI